MTESQEKSAVFVGNALLDISVKCDEKLLEEYNLKVDDNCEAEEWQLPVFDKLLAMSAAVTTPGGSAQNSARITQKILSESKGPESVYFISCIGKDKTGEILERYVSESGVRTLYSIHQTLPTGVTAGMVTSDTNRTLMANIGASKALPAEFLAEPLVQKALEQSIIHFVESYFVTHSPNIVHSLAKTSEELNRNFFLSLSATYVVRQHFKQLMALMPLTSGIFTNLSEAKAFYSELTGSETSDVEAIGRSIASLPTNKRINNLLPDIKRCVFITQGSEPIIVAKYMSTEEVIIDKYPVPPIKVSGDTIGAGDAFVGGVVAQLIRGQSVDNAVNFGITIAGKVCLNRGCVL